MTRSDALSRAVELCDEKPIRTVARALTQDYPEWFPQLEATRSALRAARGANGAGNRRQMTVAEPKLSTIAEGIRKLRTQEPEDDLEITITGAKVLVISDTHIPYHSPESLSLALERAQIEDVDVILLNGDIIDFYGISRFTREIGRMTVAQELQELHGFLHLLREQFPDARIIYKLGNHEERLRAYLLNSAKELADMEALQFGSILGCDELGIEVVRRNRVMLGKLSVLHGHELPHGMIPPVNPARGVYLRAKSSTLVGHFHQVSQHAESDLNGNDTGCWTTGCLCRMNPEYAPFAFAKWRHGFAVVEVEDDGTFYVRNHQIINGRVL
jgi:predicted phosphodiesterase